MKVPGALLCSSKDQARAYAEGVWGHKTENHPDFLVLKPEGKTAQHSIEALREVKALAFLPPTQETRRFIMIEEADRLGVVGSNALLKTLEEPFEHTTFLLVAEHPLLPTLASRCQRLRAQEILREDKDLENYVARLMSSQDNFAILSEEIASLETFLESHKTAPKISSKDKELYSVGVQEKILKEAEGEEALEQKKRRVALVFLLLKAFSKTALPLDFVEEKLTEVLLKTERFVPLSTALESFFLEIKFKKPLR